MFYAAEGNTPIPNQGGQTVVGKPVNDKSLNMDFHIANLPRPKSSSGELIGNAHRDAFDSDGRYMDNNRTSTWIPMRRDGSLFVLDVSCQLPAEVLNNPVVRQVANQ